jgi:hypothetical protein
VIPIARALVPLVVAAAVAPALPAHAAGAWSEVFAGVADTVLVLGDGGALWKAPFHLATRETLWVAPKGETMSRLRISPDRTAAAWLSRGEDIDTTRLWIWDAAGTRPAARYFSFRPSRYRSPRYEPVVPSATDPVVGGARLIRAGAMMLRTSSNALAWTAHGDLVVFGFDGGIAAVGAADLSVRDASPVLVHDLVLLEPSPVLLADAMGPPANPTLDAGTYLVYPGQDRWRFYPAAGLTPSSPWCSDGTTVWFGAGRQVRSVRAYDPAPVTLQEADGEVLWIGCPGDRVAWAAGRHVHARAGEESPRVVLTTGSPIEAVLAGSDAREIGLLTKDSLVVWEPRSGGSVAARRGDIVPTSLFTSPDGQVWVSAERARKPAVLWRLDRGTGSLLEVETPEVKGGRLVAAPGGSKLILFQPSGRPPEMVHVLDLASGAWESVVNPGVGGWEPLAAGERSER